MRTRSVLAIALAGALMVLLVATPSAGVGAVSSPADLRLAADQWQSDLDRISVLEAEVARLQAIIDTTTTTAPTSTTTAPTTTTVPSSALRWPAPALTAPTTITASGGTLTLTAGQDYIVQIPAKINKAYGVTISGGRNVVLIGGHITIPSSAPTGTNPRRALYLKGQTGTVHVEGLLIDNSGGGLSEGIQINAPQATVQIQRTRITGVHAEDQVGYSDQHPDVIQFWGGVKELRVDRFSGSTDYQALMLKSDYNNSQPKVTISRTNLWAEPSRLSRYLVWIGPDSAPSKPHFEDVWVQPADGRALAKTLWPEPGKANGPVIVGDVATYSGPNVTGTIRQGTPPGGDFVPAGSVGIGYLP